MKQFELVFYPEKQSDFYDLDKRVRDWIRKNGNEFVIAHHKPFQSEQYSNENHYHYFVSCHANWDIKALAKSLGLDLNQVQKIKSRWKSAILYARHINQLHKPLIDLLDVETNIEDYKAICDLAISEGYPEETKGKKCRIVPQCIVDYAEHKIGYDAMREQLSFLDFNEFKRDIDNAKAYRVKKGIQRDMRVLYINGDSGAGKTTLAKYLGLNLGYDVFISGSGSDPLDGYDNEECIILDDLRGDIFKKNELFKLLDNNTNSTVKSRYYNKAITFCKLLIITSIKAPSELYEWGGDDEPYTQLIRRLKYVYLTISNGKIYEVKINKDKLDDFKTSESPFKMSDVFEYFHITSKVDDDLLSLFHHAQANAREALEKELQDKLKK